MRTVIVALLAGFTFQSAIANDYWDWSSGTGEDDFTGQKTVSVYRFTREGYPIVKYRKLSFACVDGKAYFVAGFDQFINFSNQPFELLVKIDENDTIRLAMKTWSNSTDAGFTTNISVIKKLFSQMKAGSRLKWRLDTSSDRLESSVDLNGMSDASTAFATACGL